MRPRVLCGSNRSLAEAAQDPQLHRGADPRQGPLLTLCLPRVGAVADGAAKFISMPRKSPFFLHVAWTLPHNPDAADSIQADPRYTPGGLWACNRSAVTANREAVLRLAGGGYLTA